MNHGSGGEFEVFELIIIGQYIFHIEGTPLIDPAIPPGEVSPDAEP